MNWQMGSTLVTISAVKTWKRQEELGAHILVATHIKLCVSIGLNWMAVQAFPKTWARSKWFQVVVKGLSLQHPSLSSAQVVKAQSALDFSQLRDVSLHSFSYNNLRSIIPRSSTS